MNETTKRFPRTLSEAFGPGAVLEVEDEPLFDLNDRIVLWGVGFVSVVVLALCLIGVLQ